MCHIHRYLRSRVATPSTIQFLTDSFIVHPLPTLSPFHSISKMTRAKTHGSSCLDTTPASEAVQPTVTQVGSEPTTTTPPCLLPQPSTPPSTPNLVPLTLPVSTNPLSPLLSFASLESSDTLGSPENDGEPSAATPLYISLFHSATKEGCCTPETILNSLAKSNNPCPMRATMGDSAEYWAAKDGSPLHLKFLVKLDVLGQFSKIGPYFNLNDNGVRVVFEIQNHSMN